MSLEEASAAVGEVSTFSECVIGYRTWVADNDGQLWPLYSQRRPWQPGVNTARCDGAEGDPPHLAPDGSCDCGLYSMRTPQSEWRRGVALRSGTLVCGAVSSWGRIEVHDSGVRAEHACAVALAFPDGMTPDGMTRLRRVADRYRIELAPLDELEQVALSYGASLPETLQPNLQPAPRSRDRSQRLPRRRLPRRRLPRRYSGALVLLGLVAGILTLLLAFHRTTPCKVQIVSFSGAGNYESCAPSGQHGGLTYGP